MFSQSKISRATVVAAALLTAFITVARAETPLERGRYLVQGVVACGNCHTPRGADGNAIEGMELAGGVVFNAPVFRAVSANLTPDKETGLGNWSDEQIIDSIRNGKRPDGSVIGPPMPIGFYRNMSDGDVRAIVAYLRSIKPVSRKIEKSTYKIPLPPGYGPGVTTVPDVPRTDKIAYGHYLATALGHCLECHTPRAPDGRLLMDKLGAGGQEIGLPWGDALLTTPNLTPANEVGIAHWSDQQVKVAITQGQRPDRALVRLMAFDWYRTIDAADLDALVAYLRTLKPATP